MKLSCAEAALRQPCGSNPWGGRPSPPFPPVRTQGMNPRKKTENYLKKHCFFTTTLGLEKGRALWGKLVSAETQKKAQKQKSFFKLGGFFTGMSGGINRMKVFKNAKSTENHKS